MIICGTGVAEIEDPGFANWHHSDSDSANHENHRPQQTNPLSVVVVACCGSWHVVGFAAASCCLLLLGAWGSTCLCLC
jgi:hypothetical protein